MEQTEKQLRKLRRRIEEYLRQECTPEKLLQIANVCEIKKVPKILKEKFLS